MKTYKIILSTPTGERILSASNSVKTAKLFFDKYASKNGIKKDESLRLDSVNKIKSLYIFK